MITLPPQPTSQPSYKSGTRNIYASYIGQCTWWAAERYHQLSGVWVPWAGNANQWLAGAQAAGWQAVPAAPKNLPSIICLQGFAGQGANSLYGHVGVVESVNSDGSVVTSDMNWTDPNAAIITSVQGLPIRKVTFSPGPGVSFLYASSSAGSYSPSLIQAVANALMGKGGFATVNSSPGASLVASINLAPNASVTEFLVALDQLLTLINPFDIPLQTDSIAGVSFTDPVSWLSGLGQNLVSDAISLVMRLLLLIVALFLLYRVISNFLDINAAVQTGVQTAGSLANTLKPLLMA
jgi:surface antigen